jgi:sulfonate transport system permease protein
VALVAVWQLAVELGRLRYQFLPAPSAIMGALGRLTESGELPGAVLHTVSAALGGWVIASVAAVLVGLVLGLSRTAWSFTMSSVEVLRAVPAISLVPLAILLFGFSLRTEITVITYVAWWPVLVATVAGVSQVTQRHEDVARALQLSRGARVLKVVLPTAMSQIIVAMRLALSLALALAVVTEMVGNPAGVGYQMILAQQAIQPAEMFAYILVIGVIGIAFNAVFVNLTSWLLPGLVHPQQEQP